jgi:hypothetical protein
VALAEDGDRKGPLREISTPSADDRAVRAGRRARTGRSGQARQRAGKREGSQEIAVSTPQLHEFGPAQGRLVEPQLVTVVPRVFDALVEHVLNVSARLGEGNVV